MELSPIFLTFVPEKRIREGNEDRSLLLFPELNMEQQVQAIEQKVLAMLAEDPTYFLVDVKITGGNNVKVFVDADKGAAIDRLVRYNRNLYKAIEEEGIFPNNDFSLEVSSPGLDEPLKLQRQYQKNIGREVEVTMKDGIKKEGKLLSISDEQIVIEEEKGKSPTGKPTGKKKELVQVSLPVSEVKWTKVRVKF